MKLFGKSDTVRLDTHLFLETCKATLEEPLEFMLAQKPYGISCFSAFNLNFSFFIYIQINLGAWWEQMPPNGLRTFLESCDTCWVSQVLDLCKYLPNTKIPCSRSGKRIAGKTSSYVANSGPNLNPIGICNVSTAFGGFQARNCLQILVNLVVNYFYCIALSCFIVRYVFIALQRRLLFSLMLL